MLAVFEGFGVIAVIVLTGFLAGKFDLLGPHGQQVLAKIVFYIATPTLLFTTIATTDLEFIFSSQLLATGGSAAVCALLLFCLVRFARRGTAREALFSGWAVSYVNIGNLGIPIAAYVLHDISYVAPVLLFQLLILAPIGMAILDATGPGGARHWWSPLLSIVRNPIVIGSVLGIAASGTGLTLPPVLFDPLEMMGAMSVPGALLTFGLSFRDGWSLPVKGTRAHLTLITVVKLVVQPAIAWAVGGPLLGWDGVDLLAIVITSALPTAQNVFIYSMQYKQSEGLVRDAVFITTILSVPALILVSVLLG
ncbi:MULTISPECIES: AEC family transporter [Brevibacterium]|uniref:AEC family transporter n=1 Tax=Brevibacterium salitolerans TaxID=1403566 RepID=A0ABN2W9V8_9MICO|nr:AEC family transporter [Brevibacterium sp.]